MNRNIFGRSVQGAFHVRTGKECQDSNKRVAAFPDFAILSVADGHGSESCPYSKTGSEIAVSVFCKVMMDYYMHYEHNQEELLKFLSKEGELKVAKTIDADWKAKVYKRHVGLGREVFRDEQGEPDKQMVYKQYGTTLLGLMITEQFVFAFQLGDGDITFVDEQGVSPVIAYEKMLGVETHSLSKYHSWKYAVTRTMKREVTEGLPYLYMLTSDGMANSFVNDTEFQKNCRDYFSLIRENGYKIIQSNLKEWLEETSSMGCGDDITAMFAYFEK